jgi:hypothetical protein
MHESENQIAPYLSVVVTGQPESAQEFTSRWMEQANRYGLEAELLPTGGEVGARNAAIRRARGRFILVTNALVRFTDEVMQFLAARRLEKGRLYRIDSWIVAGSIDQLKSVCAREGTFAVTSAGLRRNEARDIAGVESGVHFGAGWFPAEPASDGVPFRWVEKHAEIVLRMPSGGRVLALEFEPGPGIAD